MDMLSPKELKLYLDNTSELYAEKKQLQKQTEAYRASGRYRPDQFKRLWHNWIKKGLDLYSAEIEPAGLKPEDLDALAAEYEAAPSEIAQGLLKMKASRKVVDGTSMDFQDGAGRSVLVFEHHSRHKDTGKKNPCPHCGKDTAPPEKSQFEIILHYSDDAGKWQNVVKRSTSMPTGEELFKLWEENKKPGYRPPLVMSTSSSVVVGTTFKAFPSIEFPEVLKKWNFEDESWVNEGAGRATFSSPWGRMVVWVAEKDPADRDHPNLPRVSVTLETGEYGDPASATELFTTESLEELEQKLPELMLKHLETSPENAAKFILENLTDAEKYYAKKAADSELSPFARLHDVMDANDLFFLPLRVNYADHNPPDYLGKAEDAFLTWAGQVEQAVSQKIKALPELSDQDISLKILGEEEVLSGADLLEALKEKARG